MQLLSNITASFLIARHPPLSPPLGGAFREDGSWVSVALLSRLVVCQIWLVVVPVAVGSPSIQLKKEFEWLKTFCRRFSVPPFFPLLIFVALKPLLAYADHGRPLTSSPPFLFQTLGSFDRKLVPSPPLTLTRPGWVALRRCLVSQSLLVVIGNYPR